MKCQEKSDLKKNITSCTICAEDQKNGGKVFKSCQKVVKSCQKIVKSCKKVAKRLPKKLSKSCQKVVKKVIKKMAKLTMGLIHLPYLLVKVLIDN
jgi:hypothetical protein